MKKYIVKVYKNRTEWWLNGRIHREDGPAIEYSNGGKYWYLNGKRHREDGPAVELYDGIKFWYLNGGKYTEEEFKKKTESCDGRVIEVEETIMKPCPFCGSIDVQIVQSRISNMILEKERNPKHMSLSCYSSMYSGFCECCGALGPAKPYKNEAKELWNKR